MADRDDEFYVGYVDRAPAGVASRVRLVVACIFLFAAVIAVSPSLRWDDELPIRQAREFFDGLKELKTTLFVAMANEEEGDPRPNHLDRLDHRYSFTDRTRGRRDRLRRVGPAAR